VYVYSVFWYNKQFEARLGLFLDMAKFIIEGGHKLSGEVTVSGNKNSTFPLMSAALLAETPTTLTNVPKIKDVEVMCDILRDLGCTITSDDEGTVTIDPAGLNKWEITPELGSKLRGAIVIASSLLVRFGKADFPRPGGDPIGARPLEAHLSALAQFGATSNPDFSGTSIRGENLKPAEIFMEETSVTATEMALIVAAGIEGESVIEGAAAEPHVVDLAEMLVKMGAKIEGAGTNTVRVLGVKNLKGVEHRVRPDHIEAGTFVIAAAITGGTVTIKDAWKKDLRMIMSYIEKMGVHYEFSDEETLVIKPATLVATKQKDYHTRPWPGFPTDMMSQFIVLATQAEGRTLCHDWMYEGRMYFVDRLIKMGADITVADPHRVIVVGPAKLHGELIPSPDIRAGGALVLAALVAEGESIVEHAEVIDRGFENLEDKLSALGAQIKREE
jgi:UDP-N-acetylglucosamine 1-carboxyvinyltransferase